ncbi:MAG: MFS transporter [Polyangia bacterium]|jgi:OPA family glycerol-3-phosphate transporter-like MFS transporter|nr:MFS transporter [Polyangia bacterium]
MDTLIIFVSVVLVMLLYSRMAGNPMDHSWSFRLRRLGNWLPLGLVYSFLYMGRYNLTVAKNALGVMMTKEDFGIIFAAGTATYAISFLVNGPLTDRIGGKKAILIGAFGSMAMNGLLGLVTWLLLTRPEMEINVPVFFSVVYAANMYFQSFGAVSIVKVNANWFHVRERGSFGGLFGVLISLGIYFAFDWGLAIVGATSHHGPAAADFWVRLYGDLVSSEGGGVFAATYASLVGASLDVQAVDMGPFQSVLRWILLGGNPAQDQTWWVFFIPSIILFTFGLIALWLVKDKPSQAGLADFDPGDASSGETDEKFHLGQILKKIFTNPIIITIACIEFCSGVLRNGVMHWYPIYAKEIGLGTDFFFREHWGLMLCIAGISGGMLAGFISDKVFGSRRGPVAALLYGTMIVTTTIMIFVLKLDWVLGFTVVLMSVAVIGVHGMLSGTATMDFGGRKAAGTAVGMIDGFVYLGTALQSVSLGFITSWKWQFWPVFLVPFAIIGLVLAIRIWKAFPGAAKKGAGAH